MKLITLTLFIFVSVVIFANGQDNKTFNHKADSIIQTEIVRNGKSSYVRYTLNGVPLNNSGLGEHLMSYNKSAPEFEKYKSERKKT